MKPREFWVVPYKSAESDDECLDAFSEHPGQGPLQWQQSLVHVIEKSAYTELLEQAEVLFIMLRIAPILDLPFASRANRACEAFEQFKKERGL